MVYLCIKESRNKYRGLSLYKRIQEQIPFSKNIDTAVVYRSLQSLENANAVEAYWDTSESGRPQKWYRITKDGWELLKKYKENIEIRRKNMDFFLDCYEDLIKRGTE